MLKIIKSHPLLSFCILAFVTAWCLKIPVALSFTNNIILRLLPSFLPALAALCILAIVTGKRGVSDLLRQVGRWRVSFVWYLIVLVGPIALQLFSIVLATVFGNAFPHVDFPGLRLIPTCVVAIFFALGEELGWRGFVLPRLQIHFNPLIASLLVGSLWWFWHAPEVLAGPAAGLSLLECANLEFWSLVQMLALSILMTWIYNKTGASVLLVTLLHVSSGLLGQIVAIPNGSLAAILFDIVLCIAAAIVTWTTGLNASTREGKTDAASGRSIATKDENPLFSA